MSVLWADSRKTLSPALPMGLWSYQAELSSTLSCTAPGSMLSLLNAHSQRKRGRAGPFVRNGPFCPWCICNMVSLKSSPKFRLTFLKPIIIHSHDCKKKKSSYFKFQTIPATGLNEMALTQLVPGLFYSVTNFFPSHSSGHAGCRRALGGREGAGSSGDSAKRAKGRSNMSPQANCSHTGMISTVVSFSI